ncbi:MAG: c-type cytochrome [Thermoanaerobaculia bacterium]
MIRRLLDAILWGLVLLFGARKAPRERRDPKRTWKQRGIELAILLFFVALGGFLVAASGIVPIKASSGHWPITKWFLEFGMARAFSTYSLAIEAPPLDDPALVVKGAAQYEIACAPCHGSPELHHPRVTAAMTPEPPYLPPAIGKWTPEELFAIVKHGVKLTGMPAWPTQKRSDEVWAMVAFLQRLPSLDVEAYHELAFGATRPTGGAAPIEDLTGPENLAPALVIRRCARCHGLDGRGRGMGVFPKLAGQHERYLHNALVAFARGDRNSGIMEPIAAGLTGDEMRVLARYYASLPPAVGMHGEAVPSSETHSPSIARGRAIAHRGIPEQRVPSCVDCHGPTQPPYPTRAYPMLAGQYEDYLRLQLVLFKGGTRGGSPYAHLMNEVAPKLTDEQIRDVAAYFASLR